ncbi:MAG TPA: Calx-beta domain-containing protein, partial [Caldilineaceae bacterium]|nr:Calx-beta domain-containing protein [Caldilineaceae bacterium]
VGLINGFTPVLGNSFTIIDNAEASSVVAGEFAGLPQGSVLALGGSKFIVNYSGGAGSNDVVLSVCSDTVTVQNTNSTGSGTLRQAVADVCPNGTIDFNPTLHGSTIDISPDGTIVIGKNLTIDGPGASLITVSGGTTQRVFRILADAVVAIDGIGVTGGATSEASGAGIYNAGELTLDGVWVFENGASPGNGAGVYNSGTLTMTASSVFSNSVRMGSGGGIYNEGLLSITSSAIYSNQSIRASDSGGDGGGIGNDGALTIADSAVYSNTAGADGGGLFASGPLWMAGTRVFANSAAFSGGGISASNDATIETSSITGNSANSGAGLSARPNGSLRTYSILRSEVLSNTATNSAGGIEWNSGGQDLNALVVGSTIAYNISNNNGGGMQATGDDGFPTVVLVNSTISHNRTNQSGGGFASGGALTLFNVTITGNVADANGDESGDGGGVSGEANVYNSIIARNVDDSPAQKEPDLSGQFVSGGYNLIGDNTGDGGSFTDGVGGDQVGSSAAPLDPVLGPLQNNGGPTIASGEPTYTHALGNGSPALNRGDPSDCLDNFGDPLVNDQRDFVRPDLYANRCDVGAVEMQSADAGIAKSVWPATVGTGETITFTLVISAGGTTDPVLGVVVTDTIPAGVTVTSVISSGLAFIQTGASPYTWQVDSAPVGATGYLTVTGVVSTSAALLGTTIDNTAEISAANDSFAGNNAASAAFDVVGVTIGVAPPSVAEDGAVHLTYTFTRTGPTAAPLTVNFSVGGTATFGTDYTAPFGAANGTVTIPAGSSTATVVVDPTADNLAEIAETVILTITGGPGYGVGTPASATGTIVDDDAAGVTVSDVTRYEGQSGTTDFVFTVTLTNPVDSEVSVFYQTADNTALVSDNDYNPESGVLTFPANLAGSRSLTVTVNGDLYVEADETFDLNLTGLSGNGQTLFVTDGQGSGTILNDDFADVTISKAVWPTLVEPGQALTYTLHFTNSGNGIATGVTVTDALPSDVTATGVLSSGVPITQTSTYPYTWQVANLWPDESGTITVTASLGTGSGLYGTTITNTATISASNDYTTTNNSSSAAFAVPSAPVLAIHKSVDNLLPYEAGTITYTVVVSNTGASTATGVNVDDTVAGALASNISLAVGARVTYTYPISQDDGPLTVVNTATVTSSQTSPVSASATVQWQNVAPTAALSNDGPVNDGQTALVSFSNQSDPSGAD